ncbi:UDP-N-acetylglucosamine--N-acetylmuramyl-(pentapeptide) pyrophosphoryl-undecaprenol N-acetylglucosamine transferase [bacterium]|nr:UDP-N-acetylglucosamine--N-acetylmuramyl-(pentapeptide) pyrophosphoryl-undecaprenol N-acetylglucosamine transferase [bacterium]
MKIVFTTGGSGGHFYPIIAIAEALYKESDKKSLIGVHLYFFSDSLYDESLLYKHDITYEWVPAGKARIYFSFKNVPDIFKTIFGIFVAIVKLYNVYPDIVVGKGGYASFPTLVAARLLKIPVLIHESDSVPGRVNLWAAEFAKRIAVSYPEAAKRFPSEKVAYTGNPIRSEVMHPIKEGAHEYLKLEADIPVLLVLGGSQGAERVNDAILDTLPELLKRYQVVHQTGEKNIEEVKGTAAVALERSEFAHRYKPFGYLDDLALRMAAGIANIIITRGGSTLFEIAVWGIPAIIIPIHREISRDQVTNAYNYAREGGAIVIEEENLTPHVLISEIDRLFKNPIEFQKMSVAARAFGHTDAAEKIAKEILAIAVKHED